MAGCGHDRAACARCGTVVVAATGEPSQLLPPLVTETVGRDIGDQVYERLADLAPGAAPIDSSRLSPRAGRPLGAGGLARVAVPPAARRPVAGRAAGHRRGRALLLRGVQRLGARRAGASVPGAPAHRGAGRLGDGAHPVRRGLGRAALRRDLSRPRHPAPHLGRDAARRPGQPTPAWRTWWAAARTASRSGSAASTSGWRPTPRAADPPAVRQAIWRFATDPDAALNLVLSHEADLLETVGRPGAGPARGARRHAPARPLRLGHLRVPRLPDPRRGRRIDRTRSSAMRATRRALALAVDRTTLARSAFGRDAKAPAGPDVAAALDLERQHRHAAVRHHPRPIARSTRRAGGGRTPADRAGAGAGRWRSTFWCRARARRGASSR